MKKHNQLKTVISGSYRKHLKFLTTVSQFLQKHNIEVLSPISSHAKNSLEEFIILDSDPIHDHRILQDSIFAKMRQSSFHVLANIDGYIGKAALIEIGYAISLGLNILTVEKITDPNIAPYCRVLTEVFPDWSEYYTHHKTYNHILENTRHDML